MRAFSILAAAALAACLCSAAAPPPAPAPLLTGSEDWGAPPARDYAEAPLPELPPYAGWYRLMHGSTEVTALYDGFIDLDSKLLVNATQPQIQSLLARMFLSFPKIQTAVNAYLLNTGGKLVLVDTGAAKLFGPTLGNVLQNLKAAGYDAGQVDLVLITHLHGDHMGGLIDAQGKPAFPNAKVKVAKAEADFWLSEPIAL